MQTQSSESSANPGAAARTFPDPSLTLVEFSDDGLGVLLAMKTDRDAANRRIVLSKVAYIRLEPKSWGFAAYSEVWIQQNNEGVFIALEAKGNKPFRYPSRRRFEIAFLSRELFDAAIQCLKERQIGPLYELIAVNFGVKPGFSIEAGCLLAPEDYAAEMQNLGDEAWVPVPPPMPAANA